MKHYGLVRATVTDNRDPDRLGRVRVRYHWFGKSGSGEQQSEWAHVLREVCHKESGTWSLPDKGDEVLVGFEYNEQHSPVVFGSLYNQDNKPPASGKPGDGNADQKNTLNFIKTKSGHMLIFDDSEGAGSVTLRDSAGSEFVMESSQGELHIKDKNGSKIILNSGGVTIQTASVIKIGEGASEALIKGNLFMQTYNQHTHTTPAGPSGPPQPPMTPQALSNKVKTV